MKELNSFCIKAGRVGKGLLLNVRKKHKAEYSVRAGKKERGGIRIRKGVASESEGSGDGTCMSKGRTYLSNRENDA